MRAFNLLSKGKSKGKITMRTPDEIRSIQFPKNTMGGYKQAEVDSFLDEVAMQIEQMALKMKDFDMRNRELEKKLGEANPSTSSIQSILVAAQKVAEEVEANAKAEAARIVSEAEAKAAEIEAKCENALVVTNSRLEAEKKEVEKQTAELISNTAKKVDAMTKAAKDSVEREQLLYDKLKIEMAAFRKTLTAQFLEQAELIKKLPDSVPIDPEHAAKAAAFEVEKEPDFAKMVSEPTVEKAEAEEHVSAESVLKTYAFDYESEEEEGTIEIPQLSFMAEDEE